MLYMYEQILVPTDGSANAATAMEHAIGIAAGSGASIHVINVINPRWYDMSIDSARTPVEKDRRKYIDELVEMADEAEVETETAVLDGTPAQAILDYAADQDIDLIVIGKRGRGNLENLLLGSVADYVVKHAPVPVHTVP